MPHSQYTSGRNYFFGSNVRRRNIGRTSGTHKFYKKRCFPKVRRMGLQNEDPSFKYNLYGLFQPYRNKKQRTRAQRQTWQTLLDLENEEDIIGDIFDTRKRRSIHQEEDRLYWETQQMTIFDYLERKF